MSELYGDQLNDGASIGLGSKFINIQERLTDWRLQLGLGATDALINLKNSFQPPVVKNAIKPSTQVANNVRSFQRTTLPIKDVREFNKELIKLNKNTSLLDKLFARFSKEGLKNVDGLDTKGLQPLNKTVEKSSLNINTVFKESNTWIGKLRKGLSGLEAGFEKLAAFTFGVSSIKILTDSFLNLRNEIERVNSSLKILNKTGFDPQMIEAVNKFEDSLMNFDATNVEEFATSFVSQYKNITTQLAQIGTLTQEEIRNSTEKGEDFLGDYFEKVQNMVDTSLKSTVTSSDALAATYTALQAGLQEKGGMATVDTAVENSLKLVATQGGDANAVMELLVQTMTAFNLSASSTGDILGKINKLVDVGITSIPELQNGFGQLGVSASSAGVTFDEMSGTLAQLTLAGSNTFMAMTGLNNLFNKIRSGSVTERLAEMGATLDGQAVRFDSSSVAAKGFTKSLDELNRALGGNKELIQESFGGDQEAVRAVFGALKTDVEGLDKLIQEIGKAGVKNLEDAFNIKINNDQVLQFEQILNRVSEVALKLGKILTPLFGKGIERIEKNIDRIGYLVENYGDLIFKLVELNLQMKAVNAAFGILISTIFKLIGAYTLYFFASGKLQKNIGLVWNALTKKNEAIAKGNILWDKQTNLLTKVGAVIGQLLGVYDLERKGKEQITKAEQKNIDKTLERRAIEASAHKNKIAELRAEKAEYERLERIKNNATGTTSSQRIFQERDEQKEQLKEVQVRQDVFEIETKGKEVIQTELRELESKQVRTSLEEKKLELLRNVQQRDVNISKLEKEVNDLKNLKQQGKGGLITDNELAKRQEDLRRLKDEREFDNYEIAKRRELAETAIKRGDKAEKFVSRMDTVDETTGMTRREKLIKQRAEIDAKETYNEKQEKRKQQQLGRLNRLLNADSDFRDSRNIRTLDTKETQLRRYTNDKVIDYVDQNQDKKSFKRAVDREKRAAQSNAAGNFGQDLAVNLAAASGRIGNKTVSGAVFGASQLLYGASSAAFLADSTMSLRNSFAKTGDAVADGSTIAAKTLSSTFTTVGKGITGFGKILMKLVTPTNVLVAALAALGLAIGKLTFDSEQKKNQAEKIYKDAGITPSEKPKSIIDRVKENTTGAIDYYSTVLKLTTQKTLTPGNKIKDIVNLFPGGKNLTTTFDNKVSDLGETLNEETKKPRNKIFALFGEKVVDPLQRYFNFGEKLNAPVVEARAEVMDNIYEEYTKNLTTGIPQTTKNIQQRTFDDVIVGENKQSYDYTKTIGNIFDKTNVTNKDVTLADAVKRKTLENLQTKLNAQNESLQIVSKNANTLFTNAITNSNLNKEGQTKLDEISRKVIDEKARLKERLDKKEITQEDYNKQITAVDNRTSDIFTGSDKNFLKDTYAKLNDSAKMTLENAINENVLLKERTRLYEKEKSVFDAFQEAANATQSFIKNLADVGGSNTPDARAAELGLESKIKNLGEEVGNFAKVTTAKERGQLVKPEEDARSGKIFENLQNNLPGIIEGIVNNAQSGYSNNTNKAQRLRDVIKTQVTDKFTEQGYTPEDAQRKTNALLKQYGIQQQIRQLEEDDFQKRVERITKEKQVFEVMKQSEFLITKDIVERTQKLDEQILKETIAFQQKRVEDLRTKVKTKDKKDGFDPQVLKDAENELKVTEQSLVVQRINQKREMLQYETKIITAEYEKRYAEIQEQVLKGEKQLTQEDRLDLEAQKQEEILRLNIATQQKLRDMLEREGRLTKETQLQIENEIQQARVQLLQNYVNLASEKYEALANKISKLGNVETEMLGASIRKLNIKAEIYQQINNIISQQRDLFEKTQNSIDSDAGWLRENIRSRRTLIDFEKRYYEQRKRALAEQIAFERQSLAIQKEQNKLRVETLKREQEINEERAKQEYGVALIREEQAKLKGDPLEKQIAKGETAIAKMNLEAVINNRENVRLQIAQANNEVAISEYDINLREQQSYRQLEQERVKNTRKRRDDARITEETLNRFNNGGYMRPPVLELPKIDTGITQNIADQEIRNIQQNVQIDTKQIKEQFEKNIKLLDTKDIQNAQKDELVKHSDYLSQLVELMGGDTNKQTPEKSISKTETINKNESVYKIIEKTMTAMLKVSGKNINDIDKSLLPKVEFTSEVGDAGGLYYGDTNKLQLRPEYEKGILNGDSGAMKVLVHELRHWMQDEGLTNGMLDVNQTKNKTMAQTVLDGLKFSGDNKDERDAYTYGELYTAQIQNIINNKNVLRSAATKENVELSMREIAQKQLDVQTTIKAYVEKFYDKKTPVSEKVENNNVEKITKDNKQVKTQKLPEVGEKINIISTRPNGEYIGKPVKVNVISKERASEIKAQRDLAERTQRDNNKYYQTLAELGGVIDVRPTAKPEDQIKQMKQMVADQIKLVAKLNKEGKIGAEQTQQFVKDWRTNEKEYEYILQQGVKNVNQEVNKLKKQQEEKRKQKQQQIEKTSGIKSIQPEQVINNVQKLEKENVLKSVVKQVVEPEDGENWLKKIYQTLVDYFTRKNVQKSVAEKQQGDVESYVKPNTPENVIKERQEMLTAKEAVIKSKKDLIKFIEQNNITSEKTQTDIVNAPINYQFQQPKGIEPYKPPKGASFAVGGGWSTDGKGGYITQTGKRVKLSQPELSQKTISQLKKNMVGDIGLLSQRKTDPKTGLALDPAFGWTEEYMPLKKKQGDLNRETDRLWAQYANSGEYTYEQVQRMAEKNVGWTEKDSHDSKWRVFDSEAKDIDKRLNATKDPKEKQRLTAEKELIRLRRQEAENRNKAGYYDGLQGQYEYQAEPELNARMNIMRKVVESSGLILQPELDIIEKESKKGGKDNPYLVPQVQQPVDKWEKQRTEKIETLKTAPETKVIKQQSSDKWLEKIYTFVSKLPQKSVAENIITNNLSKNNKITKNNTYTQLQKSPLNKMMLEGLNKQVEPQKFKYGDQQKNILASLVTKSPENLNKSATVANTNNKNENKVVNVTLSPKIEVNIDKTKDEKLAKETADQINKQLFDIFNEVAYKI